jgi:hypothetical protein
VRKLPEDVEKKLISYNGYINQNDIFRYESYTMSNNDGILRIDYKKYIPTMNNTEKNTWKFIDATTPDTDKNFNSLYAAKFNSLDSEKPTDVLSFRVPNTGSIGRNAFTFDNSGNSYFYEQKQSEEDTNRTEIYLAKGSLTTEHAEYAGVPTSITLPAGTNPIGLTVSDDQQYLDLYLSNSSVLEIDISKVNLLSSLSSDDMHLIDYVL